LFIASIAYGLGFVYFFLKENLQSARIIFTSITVILLLYLFISGGNDGWGFIWVLIFPLCTIPLYNLSRGNIISFSFFVILGLLLLLHKQLGLTYDYTLADVFIVLGAYAAVHLLVYIQAYFKLHHYHVLVRSVIEARNDAKQKDDFLSKLSHQIRTPLNNLTVVSNLVNKSKLDNDTRDLFETIMASTINLINVVNNIVKVSEVKIEKEAGSMVGFDLISSIESILKLFRDQYKGRIDISSQVLKSVKNNYLGDPIRIKQIFLNIIENIIKAGNGGKISIEVDIDYTLDNEEQTKFLFIIKSPLLHLESDEYGNYYSRPGADLIRSGTYQPDDYFIDFIISRKIIEYYGGEFEIDVSNNHTFIKFNLDLNKDLRQIVYKKSDKDRLSSTYIPVKKSINLTDANILLVEDNAINQKIIILSLRNIVKNIDVANNGKEALDKFGSTKYDIILMDIQMPIINGIVATKKIRELEASSNTQTPIIAITANALSGDKENCLAAGMNDYISKPFQVEVLVQKMKNLLETDS